MNVLLFIIFLVPFVLGVECPESCENGYCDDNGFCVCYPGYYGGVCPFGEALQVSPLGDLNGDGAVDKTRVRTEFYPKGMGIKEWDENDAQDRPHSYRECSNAGICNRDNGICKCREGFEGSACQRRKCRQSDSTEDCNGKGICVSSEDYIKLATAGSSGSNSWELKKYSRCMCDAGWKGVYCEKRQCSKGYDPKYYKTLFQFGYTLLDSGGKGTAAPNPDGDGSSIEHYLEFYYNGMKYRTPTIASYSGLCVSDGTTNGGEINVDLGILFKEELKKKLRHLPYFTPVDISLSCSGDKNEKPDNTNKIGTANTKSEGKFVTVVLTLDYIDITPILMMELNVYKSGTSTPESALLYGIERVEFTSGGSSLASTGTHLTFQKGSSQAVWLMKYIYLIDPRQFACYSNHRFEANKYPSYPLDIKKECENIGGSNSGGQYSIYFQIDQNNKIILPIGFPIEGQKECSGRGICKESTGECECEKNYYGTACDKVANYLL